MLHIGDGAKGFEQCLQVAWRRQALAGAAGDPFQVGQPAKRSLQLAAGERIADQHRHAGESLLERRARAQRLVEPTPQLSRAHCGGRLTDDQHREVVGGRRSIGGKAEAAPRRWVEVHVRPGMLGVQPEKTGLEPKARPLGVSQQRMGGRQCLGPLIATEGRQRLDAEQRLQPIDRRTRIELLRVHPAGRRVPGQR